MAATFGIFKCIYRSQGIYWDGSYNLDGQGSYRTLAEAKLAIDNHIESCRNRESAEHVAKVSSGEFILAHRDGDSVRLELPEGEKTITIREYRQTVFDMEDRYGKSFLFV